MDKEGREVAEVGGLHVVGTERHDSRRIDNQLRGRAGRQGDPGSSRFFLSLEDKLLRVFAGDFVKTMLGYLGMEEGEAIESPMVTRRIEGAQKKVEERHFDQRKHLLEYDEVMDEQRKQVYGFRQRILDGEDCRQVIQSMIDRQVEKWVPHFLSPDYRWESITGYVAQAYRIEVAPRQINGMDDQQLLDFLRDEAFTQADEQIAEQIEENLPADAEDQTEWNWAALSRWVNAYFNLNTSDRELKKVGREHVQDHLRERARTAIERYDFTPLGQFLADDFARKTVCGWLAHQFTLHLDTAELAGLEPHQAKQLVVDRLQAMYREKEVMFPVAVGMTNFMAENRTQGMPYDREGLARWASGRFSTRFDAEIGEKPRHEIEHLLTDASRWYYINGEVSAKVNDYLDAAYSEDESKPTRPEKLDELLTWANSQFHADLDRSTVATLPKPAARQRVLAVYESRYRPELSHAERALVLDVLDHAWKEHLYYMDHLRSGIGLVGYAQQDPKVEYKREGRKAFLGMWERIDEQVTGAIFRLEKESQAFVGQLWQITAETHSAPPETSTDPQYQDEQYQTSSGSTSPDAPPPPSDVDRGPRVGRNDLCPCGSGKKFKKCHGVHA